MKLPSKDSAVAKALRVLFYQVIMTGIALLSDKETVAAIAKYYPAITTLAVATAPFASLIYNLFRKDVKNW